MAAQAGSWWEVTTGTEMIGSPMRLPPSTSRVCQPDGDWGRPPTPRQDADCRMTDVQTAGRTMRWKMSCAGQHPMVGDGESTRSGDTLSGRIRLQSAQGQVVMTLQGHRVGGACDPDEARGAGVVLTGPQQAQADQARAGLAAGQALQCESAIEQVLATAVAGEEPLCRDPARRETFCARLRTEEGYLRLKEQAGAEEASGGMLPGPQAAARACGLELAKVARSLCGAAARQEHLGFLGAACPAEARVIVKRECAGRTAESLEGSRYGDFCRQYGGVREEAPAMGTRIVVPGAHPEPDAARISGPAAPQKPTEESAAEKSKKALRGLFGL
jgi:hypothetical protein